MTESRSDWFIAICGTPGVNGSMIVIAPVNANGAFTPSRPHTILRKSSRLSTCLVVTGCSMTGASSLVHDDTKKMVGASAKLMAAMNRMYCLMIVCFMNGEKMNV